MAAGWAACGSNVGAAVCGGFSGSLQQAERLREQKKEGKRWAEGAENGTADVGRRKQGVNRVWPHGFLLNFYTLVPQKP